MRSILVAIAMVSAVFSAACTKKNPNLCCTDSNDCEAQGLPDDAQCGDGLVCRGNQCIAEACAGPSDCDAAAPYCLLDQGRCAEACTADTQCPGFGQDASEMFCVGGACVACRADMNDCSVDAPVCDAGACRRCVENSECPSGACATDGTCVADADIAVASPTGSATSDCTKLSPCTLTAAIALSPPRSVIELLGGLYSQTTKVSLGGVRRIIGIGTERPQVTRTTAGDVFSVDQSGSVTFEHLEVFGALGTASEDGAAIASPFINATLSRTIHADDVFLHDNFLAGISTHGSSVLVTRSTLTTSQRGVTISDGSGTIDRCIVTATTSAGLALDGGVFSVTNTFITRNSGSAMQLNVEQPGTHLDFVTVADNASGIFISGDNTDHVTAVRTANSIIARNPGGQLQCDATSQCISTGSIIAADVAGFNFKSPDVAPFDYHITSGSAAIDAADPSVTIDHDVDGDHRPLGNAMDVGADELK